MLLVFLTVLASQAQSNRKVWTGKGANTNFMTAGNWQGNANPDSSHNVTIEVEEATTVDITTDVVINSLDLSIKITGNNKNTPDFVLNFNIHPGASLTILNYLTVRNYFTAAFSPSVVPKDNKVVFNVDGSLICVGNASFASNGDTDSVFVTGSGDYYFQSNLSMG
ncbi:MAG: hypothetical protein LPJ89_09590, partial [Hymenobacteraceae bacterium]|nr:hypothetical protein [Hymenobacteraceae bacterium]